MNQYLKTKLQQAALILEDAAFSEDGKGEQMTEQPEHDEVRVMYQTLSHFLAEHGIKF